MARKSKSKGKRSNRQRAEWEGFIDRAVTSSEKEIYVEWLQTQSDVSILLREVLDGGYRVAISADGFSGGYAATLFAQYADMDNAGWNLSARSSDPIESFFRVVFLHSVVLGGEWEDNSGDSDNDSW